MNFTENLVAALQYRLADLGYYQLTVDGLPGPGTSNAVIRFKEQVGLRARDLVGPITLTRLFDENAPKAPKADPVVKGEPPWLTEARSLLGLKEVPGPGNNPRIMKMARDLDQWYPGDDTPWCGLFVAHCMNVGAPKEPQNFNRLGARDWLEFGEKTDPVDPLLGSVCVLWRTHKTKSWHGHVFLVTGYNDTHIRGIGGNQSDTVQEDWFDRSRILGCRVPTGYHGPIAPREQTGRMSAGEA